MDEIVSPEDHQKHYLAEVEKRKIRLPKFFCPQCQRPCHNYRYDWHAVNLFRANYTNSRYTFILVDIKSSIEAAFVQLTRDSSKGSHSRILKTKEAIKQLLREIADAAQFGDKAELAIFANKLIEPSLIPLCDAINIDKEINLNLIDQLRLGEVMGHNHLYAVLKKVYDEILAHQRSEYIDLYLFSDGVDTSPMKNHNSYRAHIRSLNEQLGVKLHLVNFRSFSNTSFMVDWLGDADTDCSISGDSKTIQAQIKAIYRKNHPRISNSASMTVGARTPASNVSWSLSGVIMAD